MVLGFAWTGISLAGGARKIYWIVFGFLSFLMKLRKSIACGEGKEIERIKYKNS